MQVVHLAGMPNAVRRVLGCVGIPPILSMIFDWVDFVLHLSDKFSIASHPTLQDTVYLLLLTHCFDRSAG